MAAEHSSAAAAPFLHLTRPLILGPPLMQDLKRVRSSTPVKRSNGFNSLLAPEGARRMSMYMVSGGAERRCWGATGALVRSKIKLP